MSKETFVRTGYLLGGDYADVIEDKRICVFGVGGVGGHCIESLARFGFRHFVIVDHDEVNESNMNRQIIATSKTIGRKKVDVMKERLLEINPEIEVETYPIFFDDNTDCIDLSSFDYVVDCIDAVSSKIELIKRCNALGIRIISSMGCGNRLDPRGLDIIDLAKTSNDPLAKVMRQRLRKEGIIHVKVLCSSKPALKPIVPENADNKRILGSSPFVPSSGGILLAFEVAKDIVGF